MNNSQSTLRAAGILFIRVLLGIIFFMQGYGKIFTFTVSGVYEKFFKEFENTSLPKWLILFIIGLFRKYALYLLALDLLIVSFGHGLMEPIWDLSHVMPRTILLASLFLLPEDWDRWNVDQKIKNDK